MTQPRITLLASQERTLATYLDGHPLGHERGAIVLFRRFCWSSPDVPESDRYLAIDVIPFDDGWITSSSGSNVAFELKHFREVFRRCEEELLVFGFAHNHPGGPLGFSEVDDENEKTLLQALRNRNGPAVHLVALLRSQGAWKARVRFAGSPDSAQAARHVLIVNQPLSIHLDDSVSSKDEALARQAAAFGKPFVEQFRSLRVAVIGAGGTGSPTTTLLARSGIGEIVVIDGDRLEASNLNRVRGARATDIAKNKARLIRDYVQSLGLPVRVAMIEEYVDLSPEAVDALASCDVVFGCTDDQIGRELLNAALYVYGNAYIDTGLGGQITQGPAGDPYLRYHFGRVSTILPESGECLFCQGVLSEVWIRHQYATRANPDLTHEELRDRYLEGGGEQAPGIGPFTSAVADYGVATLFDLVRPFRKFPPELRRDFFTIDFVRMQFRSRQFNGNSDCVYCQQRSLLLMAEEYRLNRPALGKRHACV